MDQQSRDPRANAPHAARHGDAEAGRSAWREHLEGLRDAYAPATIAAAVRAFEHFQAWSERQDRRPLPASPWTVAAFIDDHVQLFAPRSLDERLAGVRRIHLAAGLANPLASEVVRLARLRHRVAASRPRRLDLTADLRDRLLAACPTSLIGLRDRAMISLGFDTLCRRSELTLLRIEDLVALPDGTARIAVRRLQDAAGPAHDTAHLSRCGRLAVETWLAAAGQASGPILRVVINGRVGARSLGPREVNRRLHAVGRAAGLVFGPLELTCQSLRVGGAQALGASGRTLAQVMRAGRWRSLERPARYVREAGCNIWSSSHEVADEPSTGRATGGAAAAGPSAPDQQTQAPPWVAEKAGCRDQARWRHPAPSPAAHWAEAARRKGEGTWAPLLETLCGAYSERTLRGYLADLKAFQRWCDAHAERAAPSRPEAVAAYVDHCAERLARSTVLRRLEAIARAHALMQPQDPTRSDLVHLAKLRLRRAHRRPARQALPIDRAARDRLLRACGEDLPGLRDRALIWLGYDGLCRGSELAGLRIQDLEPASRGGARVRLLRAKNDRFGHGAWAHLSAAGAADVGAWIAAAALREGPILRRSRYHRIGLGAMSARSVSARLRSLAQAAGFAESAVRCISSHSLRVGAVHDLARDGATLMEMMRAGRWRSSDALADYLRQLPLNPWAPPAVRAAP